MSTFDQRGQTVQYQYNAAGNINIDSIDTKLELTQELEKLKAEITKASEAKVIDAELADDATHELNKVITESKKPEPDKTVMLSRVEKAKSLVTNVGALAGVAGALVKIGELIVKVIP